MIMGKRHPSERNLANINPAFLQFIRPSSATIPSPPGPHALIYPRIDSKSDPDTIIIDRMNNGIVREIWVSSLIPVESSFPPVKHPPNRYFSPSNYGPIGISNINIDDERPVSKKRRVDETPDSNLRWPC